MEEQIVKFEDILKATVRKWKIAVLVAVIFTILAAFVSLRSENNASYDGSIKILVKNENMILANNMQVKKDDKLIPNYIEMIKTRDFLNSALKNVQLEDKSIKLTPEIVLGKLKVTNIPSSDFILIQYSSENKEETIKVVNALINEFKEKAKEYNNEAEFMIEDAIGITEKESIKSSKKLIFIGAVGGFVLAAGIIFVYECINRRFRTTGEVERVLKLKVLGVIPKIKRNKGKKSEDFIVKEGYNNIATNIKYSDCKEKKVFLVTSSILGEGSSTTAIGVAEALALGKEKVVLIDNNLRNSSVGTHYGISGAGISDVVKNNVKIEDTIHSIKDNLCVISAGNSIENPVSIIDSEEMDKVLEELRVTFDYIILDTPPVKVVSDATILSSKADGTIIVVRAEKANFDTVKGVVETLDNVKDNIIGVVFNEADTYLNKFYKYE